jgi:hypothetical protein
MISLCDSATARNSNSLDARYVDARGKYVGMRVEPPGAKNLNSSLLSEETHALVQKLVYSIRMCVCARCSSHVYIRAYIHIFTLETHSFISRHHFHAEQRACIVAKNYIISEMAAAHRARFTPARLCARIHCATWLAGWLCA